MLYPVVEFETVENIKYVEDHYDTFVPYVGVVTPTSGATGSSNNYTINHSSSSSSSGNSSAESKFYDYVFVSLNR